MSATDLPPRPAALRFVRGEGQYVADVRLPHMLHAFILRSPEAHAKLEAIDTDEAASMTGVRLLVTGTEIAAATAPQPIVWDLPGQRRAETRSLAHDRVRYVGEPVALIVADSERIARRAAARIRVRYGKLPAVTSAEAAEAPDSPRLYEDWPDNVVARANWLVGDVDAAFEHAAFVTDGVYISRRMAGLPLEARAVLAAPDAARNGLTVWTSTQAPHQVRAAVASCLRMPEHRVRVIAPDVGGAFGTKSCVYGEETLMAYAARKLRRPVRWIEDRHESFTSSVPGRDETVTLSLAFDAQGILLAMRGRVLLNKGAEPYAASIGSAWTGGMMLPGGYRVPALAIEALGVVTNTTPTGAFRGYGQPEVNFAVESAFDEAARRMQIDPAELRRRNLVRESEMPFQSTTGLVLDSGRYHALLDLALAKFGWDAARERTARERSGGTRSGVGLAFYVEATNMGPSPLCGMVGVRSGGFDVCQVRVEPSGQVSVFTGQTPMGQGVEAALAQLCAEELTLPIEDVVVIHGDTASCAYTGYSSGGSRGAGVGGSALIGAARKVKHKLLLLAAHLLDANAADLLLVQGGVQHRDDPTRRRSITDLAQAAYLAASLPAGMEAGLDERMAFDPPALGISYGVALCEVALCPDLIVRVRRILFAHDCGRQIRPDIVEGQIIGGIAQGLGTALYEQLLYEPDGTPRTTSLRDYDIPFAADMPPIELVHLETPSPFFPHGAKGVGESGVIPIPAAIANAVRDAQSSGDASLRLDTVPLIAGLLGGA
ncbi:MAG: xanthine dehydrogenase, molybdenum binding subunit apoprotein [Rhodospirillales bacterium]|nr:xanthine dehydrogenase, molybdenum binding subunit apoprotein [Rhodospirillales bacterium]